MTQNAIFLTLIVAQTKHEPDFMKVYQKIFRLINLDDGYFQYRLRNGASACQYYDKKCSACEYIEKCKNGQK